MLSVLPTPSNSASPDSGRGARRTGRITPRGYPKSARIEPNMGCDKSRLRLDLQGLQRKVHHAVKDRPRDLDAEVVGLRVRGLHVHGEDDLGAVSGGHADVA